jgi:hypothetical protein
MKKRLLTLAFILLLVCVCPSAALAAGTGTANSDPAAITPADFTFTAASYAPFNNGYEECTAVEQADGTYRLPVPVTAVAAAGASITITAPNGYTEPFSVTYTAYENNTYSQTAPEKTVQSVNGEIVITDHFVSNGFRVICSDLHISVAGADYSILLNPYAEPGGLTLLIGNSAIFPVVKTGAGLYAEVWAGRTIQLSVAPPHIGNLVFNCFVDNDGTGNWQFSLAEDEERTFSIKLSPHDSSYGFDENTYVLNIKGVASPAPLILNYEQPAMQYNAFANQNQEMVIALQTQNTDENTIYQWEGNGTQGTDPSTFNVNTAKPGVFNVKCTLTNTVGGVDYSVSTGTIHVWVRPADSIDPPTFSLQPIPDYYYVGDGATPLSAQAEPFTTVVTITYQWYSNTTASNSGGTAVGEPFIKPGFPSTYTPPTTEAGSTWYYCQAVTEWQCLTENGYVTYTSEPAVTEAVEIKVLPAELPFSGAGTSGDPYLIKTYADLKELRDRVAMGSGFEGLYFKMNSDIATESDWTPIGITVDGTNNVNAAGNLRAFKGTFDGGGHTLTVASGGLPLFGYVQNTTIKNLKIYGPQINGYGLVNNFYGYGLSGTGVTIDGVTVLGGTNILKSGLLGGEIDTGINGFAGVSAEFTANISNCTIQSGVTVGSSGNQNYIGSFAGRFQGTIENCTSAATVKGKGYVGGIIGTRDNALGNCQVINCQFHGTVQASGDNVGGIVGGGYSNSTAPNGIKVTVKNCTVDGSVTGVKNVGGILGGDVYVACAWNYYTFSNNRFTGTVSGSQNVGGVIGFLDSLNKNDNIINNYYAPGCGASKGIGKVVYVDTNCATHETASGAIYFNTQTSTSGCPDVLGCHWQVGLNRTDDPLGADAYRLTGDSATAPFVVELTVTGYKDQYMVGEAFDKSGIVVTATYSDGSTADVSGQATFSGFDSSEPGRKTVTAAFGGMTAAFTVNVVAPSGDITVKLTVLGDTLHDMPEGDHGHGLWLGGLTEWLPQTEYTVDANATVWDLLNRAFDADDTLTLYSRWTESYGSYYIYAVQKDELTLTEKDNCDNSGWMVAVNGVHVQVGVSLMTLKNGDSVTLHWCDDYVADESEGARQEFAARKPAVKAEGDKKTGKIKLTITPVPGAVKYRILVAEKAEGPFTLAAETEEETYTYSGNAGTRYFFKVVAVNASGVESAESAAVSIVRLPGQVTGLKATSKKKQVTLKWKKVTGAKKYFVYMSKNGKTGWKKVGTTTKTTYVYKKGTVGKKLYFRVLAVTANGKKGEFSKAVSVKVKK